MGKHYVVLSFFKSNGIDYYFVSESKTILFPCPFCWGNSTMCAITTNWSCESCSQTGNLLTLIKINKEDPIKGKIEIFDPKKERIYVNKIFDEILSRKMSTMDKTILNLKNKVNMLIDYYENSS